VRVCACVLMCLSESVSATSRVSKILTHALHSCVQGWGVCFWVCACVCLAQAIYICVYVCVRER